MKEFYITGLPPIVNVDDGESEEVTKNTIMEILIDDGYEFLEEEE